MSEFQARWVSKQQSQQIRRSGCLKRAMLLDSFKGFVVIEPKESPMGDGELLSPEEVEFEIRPEWCMAPKSRVQEARRMLGIEAARVELKTKGQ